MSSCGSVCYGLDLGTTYSTIGCLVDRNSVAMSCDCGSVFIPSVVAVKGTNFLVGNAAYNVAYNDDSWSLFKDMKRWVGCTQDDITLEKYKESINPHYQVGFRANGDLYLSASQGAPLQLTLLSLLGLLVRGLVSLLESATRSSCDSLVISVPANFTILQRNFYTRITAVVGLKLQFVLNEPSAALICANYRRLNCESIRLVMIYDFGGGTFDVCAASILSNTVVVSATGGDTFLGGRDVDNNIRRLLNNKYMTELMECNDFSKLKEQVSKYMTKATSSLITWKRELIVVTLEFEELLTCCSPLIDKSLKHFDEVYLHTGWKAPVEVYLVGGSSSLPTVVDKIRQRPYVSEVFDLPEKRSAVSVGCSLYSRMRLDNSVRLFDVLNTMIHDVTSGFMPTLVLPKYSPIPCVSTYTRDFATTGVVRTFITLFEGSGNRSFKNNVIYSKEVSSSTFGMSTGPMTLEIECNVTSLGVFTLKARALQSKAPPLTFTSQSEDDLKMGIVATYTMQIRDSSAVKIGGRDYANVISAAPVFMTGGKLSNFFTPNQLSGEYISMLLSARGEEISKSLRSKRGICADRDTAIDEEMKSRLPFPLTGYCDSVSVLKLR
ncbi:heat shock protein 70 homolog [Blueberry virus A]|uniref:Heat shock protein 70 homolog n=1 Tax=Blueberry virus A TaxID=1206566 RepID=J7M626_9CLOS|nr:heat shock protein 70 homolog [Blueberry virus A]BAM37093.1 heat shock protein 70 homolog [Blueberry virus A]